MATASEWARIRELAAAADMDLSRYIVHRATVPDPLPDTVLRRAVRELLLLAKIKEQQMADLGWRTAGRRSAMPSMRGSTGRRARPADRSGRRRTLAGGLRQRRSRRRPRAAA